MARFSIPTTAKLPPTLRIRSSNTTLRKSVSRLARDTLISLVLDWLDDEAIACAFPHLAGPDVDEDDVDDLYPPCRSVLELRDLYMDWSLQRGSRRDVVERVLDGDWRNGLTLYQFAMVDLAYLDDHPTSQRWNAYQIVPLEQPSETAEGEVLKIDRKSLAIPRFHPSTFLQNLQEQVLPDIKAHYHFYRPKCAPILLLRMLIVDSPYNSGLALSGTDSSGEGTNFESARVIYLAFPDGTPSLYLSASQSAHATTTAESKSLRNLILDGVPKALSRPRERFTLKSTGLSSRNLTALLDKKGPGRTNAAGGGWSIYANEKDRMSPLDTVLPSPPLSMESACRGSFLQPFTQDGQNERSAKRRKLAGKARFGYSGNVKDGKGVESVQVAIRDPFPSSDSPSHEDVAADEDDVRPFARRSNGTRRSEIDAAFREYESDDVEDEANAQRWTPHVTITFRGTHVFAGIRQLVEAGIVDGSRMPGWMTGEEGVTIGVVRRGRIRGHKGSGV